MKKKEHIPLCRPRSNKQRLPWMRCAKIKRQRSRRWRSWNKFKATSLPRDCDAYKFERNRLNDIIREAKRRHEQGLIADLKENPNLYFGHCRRSLKNKQGVANVIDGEGKLTETEAETAAALNTYYHSVFTKDDPTSTPPSFPDQTQERLTDITVTAESVKEILLTLNPDGARWNRNTGHEGMRRGDGSQTTTAVQNLDR